jgi:hypothetical protein
VRFLHSFIEEPTPISRLQHAAIVAAEAAPAVAPAGVKVMPKNPTPVLKPTIPVIEH